MVLKYFIEITKKLEQSSSGQDIGHGPHFPEPFFNT